MSRTFKVYLPSQKSALLPVGSYEERLENVNHFLDEFAEDISEGWLCENLSRGLRAENHVKGFLDRLAYYLLLGETEDVVTDFKWNRNRKYELPLSSCLPGVTDAVYSDGFSPTRSDSVRDQSLTMLSNPEDENSPEVKDVKVEKKYRKIRERSRNLRKLIRKFGNAPIISCIVDTENEFEYDGVRYKISKDVKEYSPTPTRLGVLYDMDRIYVVPHDGKLNFFTQEYVQVSGKKITKTSPENLA